MSRRGTAERIAEACALLAPLLLLSLASAPRTARAAEGDPAALELAQHVIEALGGAERWEALRGLRWSFGAEVNDTLRNERRHAWDKHTGWHRVEGRTRDGGTFCFIHNIHTGEGQAWMNGHTIEGDSLATLLARAKSLWINDTYWMLMPYKLLDPGVHLTLEKPVTENGVTYDRLALSFEAGIGETPDDRYWVWIERGTHRVHRWEMVLTGREPPPVAYTWEGWEEHAGLWFPTAHRRDSINMFTRDIQTVASFRAEEFREP